MLILIVIIYFLLGSVLNRLYFQEANNLTNLSSYRYNGLIHKKSIGIIDAPDKKGFTVVYKKASKHVSNSILIIVGIFQCKI